MKSATYTFPEISTSVTNRPTNERTNKLAWSQYPPAEVILNCIYRRRQKQSKSRGGEASFEQMHFKKLLNANSHRRRRRDWTVELRRVGVGGVCWA